MSRVAKWRGNDAQLEEAWQLKKYGVPITKIADRFNMSREDVKFALDERARAEVDNLGGVDVVRALEASKLDEMENLYWGLINDKKKKRNGGIAIPDHDFDKLINMMLKILERRSKLLGLDAPIKHQVNLRVFDQFTAQLIEIIQTHCTPEQQKKINHDINRALAVAEKYRSEDEEQSWTQAITEV